MNINEAIRRLDNAVRYLESGEAVNDAMIAATDTVALVTNRVIQRGEDEKGQKFTPYSTEKIPAFFYKGKSRNASAERKVEKAIKDKTPLSYKEFRSINNLNTDKKTFEFSGLMWRGFGVKKVSQRGTTIEIVLGGKTVEAANRLEWNSEREGKNIAQPSIQEMQLIKQTISDRVLRKLQNG